MNLQKATTGYAVSNNDEDETHRVSFRVRLNARDRKQALRSQYTTRMLLQDAGYIREYGCNCRHCRNDWDCCGNLFPSYVEIKPAKRGIKVTQHYLRNV